MVAPLRTPEDVATWLEGLDDDEDAIPPRVAERRRELEAARGLGGVPIVSWICALKPFEMSAKDAAVLLRARIASDRVAEQLRAEAETPQDCRRCGAPSERDRWCYAIPMCHACLPPPEPLPVVPWPPPREVAS